MHPPILVIFERHWNKIPKEILIKNLLKLKELGYSTFCYEASNGDGEQKTILEQIKSNVETYSMYEKTAIAILRMNNIDISDFSTVPYEQLCHDLHLYVSPKDYDKLAVILKGLSGIRKEYELHLSAIEAGFKIIGIDIPELPTIEYFSAETISPDLMKKRDHHFAGNLKQLYEERKGVVFLCGASHANGLLKELTRLGLIYQTLCYTVSSSVRYSYELSVRDEFNLIGISDENNELVYIDTEEEANQFSQKLINEIENNNKYIQALDHHQNTSLINNKTGLAFTAYLRTNHYVDAILDLSNTNCNDEKAICNKLNGYKIKHTFGFFHDKKHLIIPRVNVSSAVDEYLPLLRG